MTIAIISQGEEADMPKKYKKGMRKFSYFKQGTKDMESRLDAADIPKYQKRKIEQALRKKRKQEQED